jgi:hypothetical protein
VNQNKPTQLANNRKMVGRHTNINMSCSLDTAQHFRGIYRLHLQGKRVIKARNQQEQMASSATSAWCPFLPVFWLAYSFTLKIEVIHVSELSGSLQATAMLFIYIPQPPWTQVLPSCVLRDGCVSINSVTKIHCHQVINDSWCYILNFFGLHLPQ